MKRTGLCEFLEECASASKVPRTEGSESAKHQTQGETNCQQTDGILTVGQDDREHAAHTSSDDLSDLFGNLDDDSDSTAEPGTPPASTVAGGEIAHSTLRRALRRIESDAEQFAQMQSVGARKVDEILKSPTVPSRSPSVRLDQDDKIVDKPSESWLQWVEREDGSWGVTLACVREAAHRLKSNRDAVFPISDILRVLRAAAKPGGLVSDVGVRRLEIPTNGGGTGGGCLMILGDTHGQLEDVLWIFYKHGEPRSSDNVYLFNGDVVDRGERAIEILMLMALYNFADPGSVFMNRGNHEDSYLSKVFGFHDECIKKYGRENGHLIYDICQDLFNHLPICSLVDAGAGQRLFIVHGGPPRKKGASLEEIAALDFRREIPDPVPGKDDELFYDCLWSDPQPFVGIGINPRGPDVAKFGPDITAGFLEKNNLDIIIRSHEVPSRRRGVEWLHRGKLLTVFTASNYTGKYGNTGGVVKVQRGQPLETSEHWAGTFEELVRLELQSSAASEKLRAEAVRQAEKRTKNASRTKDVVDSMHLYMLEHIKEGIVSKKAELFALWAERDQSADFHISPDVWRQGMAQHFGHELPWEMLQEKLDVVDSATGMVPYLRFLQRFHVAHVTSTGKEGSKDLGRCGWQLSPLRCVFESLLCADLPIRETLAALDRNNDGEVSVTELTAIISDCGVTLSPHQCRTMLRSFAMHRTGTPGTLKIKLFDFLDSITVAFSAETRPAAVGADEWIPKSLGKVARILLSSAASKKGINFSRSKELTLSQDTVQLSQDTDVESIGDLVSKKPAAELLARWFYEADADGNGYLSLAELEAAFRDLAPEFEKMGLPVSEDSRRALAKYLDLDGSGNINYVELLASMVTCEVADLGGKLGPLGEDLLEAVSTAIYVNRATLLRSLRLRFDAEGDGRVTVSEFVEGLTALNAAALPHASDGSLLPKEQIEALALELAHPDGGDVQYEEFINSFQVVDSGRG